MVRWMVFAALVAGCGGGSEPTYRVTRSPQGFPAAIIDCRNDPGGCYVLAGEICPNGYDTLMSSDREGFEGRGFASKDVAVARAETFTAKTIMISCRSASGRRGTPPAQRQCGYTCGPQPRECPWLDKDGCVKPGHAAHEGE